MRWIRGIINAVLMATLVKPLVRRMVARWRRRARESAVATIGIPAQGLFETALMEELAAPAVDLRPSPAQTPEQLADGGMIRTLLITGAVVATIAVAALAIAAVIRRRREAHEAQADGTEWAAVPVNASIDEAEEAVAQGTLIG